MNSRRISSTTVSAGPKALHLRRSGSQYSSEGKWTSGLFRAVILTAWDNILGPSAVAHWNLALSPEDECANKRGSVSDDRFPLPAPQAFLPFIANHTLNGEICRDYSRGNIDVKVSTFVLNDIEGGSRSVASSTFIFSSTTAAGHASTHSLALLFDADIMQTYFVVHGLVAQRVKRMIGKYRVLSERPILRETALTTLTDDLSLLGEFVSHWRKFGLVTSQSVSAENTFFSPHHSIDSAFLRRAIASHLATSGCSVVIGACPHKANLMIGTLSLLLNSRERQLCTYLQPTKYFPGLLIQGILKDSVEAGDVLTKDLLLSSSLPTTIIDMDCLRVQRTSSISKHRKLRQDLLLDELEDLYGRRPEMSEGGSDDDVFSFSSAGFSRESGVMAETPKFERGDIAESMVGDFLEKIQTLNPESSPIRERDGGEGDEETYASKAYTGLGKDEGDGKYQQDLRLRVEKIVSDFRSRLFANAKSFVHLVLEYLKNVDSKSETTSGTKNAINDNISVNSSRKSSITSLLGGRSSSSSSRPTSPGVVKIDVINEFLEARGLSAKDDLILLVSTAERFKPGFNEMFIQHFGSFFKRSSWILR